MSHDVTIKGKTLDEVNERKRRQRGLDMSHDVTIKGMTLA
jgi:hypothetical protein